LPEQWQAIKGTIRALFGPGWVHKRVEQELAKANNIYNNRVLAGQKGGFAKASKRLATLQQNASKSLAKAYQLQPQLQRKKDGADAPLPAYNTAEKELFDRGKEILGPKAGGLIRKVLKAKGENVALARAAIEQASTKQSPLEYVGRIAAGPPDSTPPNIRERMKQAGFYAQFGSPEQRAWEKHTGKSIRDADGGWLYPAQWPNGDPT
jgi:hypothetical protein